MWGHSAILLKSSSLFSTNFLFWYLLFVGIWGAPCTKYCCIGEIIWQGRTEHQGFLRTIFSGWSYTKLRKGYSVQIEGVLKIWNWPPLIYYSIGEKLQFFLLFWVEVCPHFWSMYGSHCIPPFSKSVIYVNTLIIKIQGSNSNESAYCWSSIMR